MSARENVLDQVLEGIGAAGTKYCRLVLLVGPTGSGKTSALRAVHTRTNAPIRNIGLKLSALMLELSDKERTTGVSRLLEKAAASPGSDALLLDNIEILFDPSLHADPLQLLKSLSKTRTVAVAWPGRIEANRLFYGEPAHPEYRRYAVDDLAIVEMGSGKCGR